MGKLFDLILIGVIIFSVLVTIFESIPFYNKNYFQYFYFFEIVITAIFTIEYVLRVWCIRNPKSYIFSLYGIIDLLSILPTYLSLIFTGTQYLSVLRLLRILRIFRVLKLTQYIKESQQLLFSLQKSSRKILVFFFFLFILVCVLGAVMFAVESPSNPGFADIPHSIYWAIVTITTVGYGDISPITPLGKMIASLIMILGYSIITVPTGIVSIELYASQKNKELTTKTCQNCTSEGHLLDSKFCKDCGHLL